MNKRQKKFSTITLKKNKYKMDVFNHPMVKIWLKNLAINNPEAFVCLSKDNYKIFKKIWGKPHQKGKNKTYIWNVYGNNLHWVIYSSSKGTCFYIIMPINPKEYIKDSNVGTGIIQFLSELVEFLMNS